VTAVRRTIDVSGLPEYAFGHRDPLWWGVIGLMAIEGTMLALLAATWFYVRGNFTAWPPQGVGARVQLLAALEAAALALSAWPTHLLNLAAERGDLRKMRLMLGVVTGLGLAYLVLRSFLYAALPFRWDLNAYASVLWGTLVLNTTHGLSGVLENATMLVLLFTGPIEKKHLVDVHAGGFLWYFVLFSWIPLWFLMFAAPLLLRS
jgi:cytochrome c oxidase subunit 3